MAKQRSKKQRNVFWLGVVSYFTDVSSEMITPILPIFYEQVLGLNKTLIGLIEGTAESIQSFLKVISGYLSDKFKKRKIFIVIGYTLPAFLKPAFALATVWWHVFIIRIFERSGKGLRDPPRDALIAASTSVKHYGSAFGFQRMMDTSGAVTGVIILTTILYFLPETLRAIFLIALIPGLISASIAFIKVKEHAKPEEKREKINFRAIIHMPKSYKFFLFPTFIFAIGNMSYAFFILRAQNLGLSLALIPVIYLIYTITYAALALPAGKLADKIGKIPGLIIGNLFFLGACVLFILKLPTQLIWIVFLLYGVFFAFNVSIAKAYISNVVPLAHTATAIGIHNFIMGISALPASAVAGFLWDRFSPEIAFGYSAILTIISTVLYFVMLILFRPPKAQEG